MTPSTTGDAWTWSLAHHGVAPPPNRVLPSAIRLYVWAMTAVSLLPVVSASIETAALQNPPAWVWLTALTLTASMLSATFAPARGTILFVDGCLLTITVLFGPGPSTLTVVLISLLLALWQRNGSQCRVWFTVAGRVVAV